MNDPKFDQALALLEAAVSAHRLANNKFGRKLTFEQQCEILALHRKGVTRVALATLYNIDRRTVTHINNPESPHYKTVREAEFLMGRDNFSRRYLKLDMLEKAATLVMPEPTEKPVNSKQANRMSGVHVVKTEMTNHEHRVIIQWVEKNTQSHIEVSGWYYKDLDSEWPDMWSCPYNMPEALKTSQACYTAMLTDISDL